MHIIQIQVAASDELGTVIYGLGANGMVYEYCNQCSMAEYAVDLPAAVKEKYRGKRVYTRGWRLLDNQHELAVTLAGQMVGEGYTDRLQPATAAEQAEFTADMRAAWSAEL